MLVELRAVFFIHFSPGWGPPGAGLMYSLIVPSPIRILIGSISMYPSVLPASIYSACKAGVIQVTTVWAMELAEFGIRVNCISPGAIVTQIFWGGYGTEDPEENARKAERLAEYFAEVLPLKRAGLPEDIAGAAVFLASEVQASRLDGIERTRSRRLKLRD